MASTVPWGEGPIAESWALQRLPLAVFVLVDDEILDVNEAACRLLGHEDRSTLIGRALDSLVRPNAKLVEVSGAGSAIQTLEQSLIRADGSLVTVDLVKVPLPLEGREVTLLVAEEPSDFATMRTQLVHAHGLATVGALAAGVAHEINNPLTYLIMGLDRVVSAVGGTPVERHARMAQQGAERIRGIVHDLQSFGRGDGDKPQPLDVEAVLDRVLSVTALGIHYRAAVVRDFGGVGPVLGHEGRLAQLFASILVDASHAIDEGHAGDNEISIATRVEQEHVEVTVAANQLHRTVVRLPISRASDSSMRRRPLTVSPAAPAAKLEGRPRVLVVDDEPLVRDVLAERLERFADVELATSGREAVERLRSGEYHAVLADLMMPDMTGMDLFEWIASNRPAMSDRVVFMTGGAFTAKGRDFLARVDNPIVEKPVVEAELLAALVRVLGRARRTTAQARSA